MEAPAEATLIEWNPQWDLGIALIDSQHQRLVAMIRELQEDARTPEVEGQTLLFILFEILDYAITHFTDEETLFLSKGWSGEAAHLAEHEAFLHNARTQLETFRNDAPQIRDRTIAWLVSWLKNHIARSDREVAEFVRSIGMP